jgi:hypothetical protein
LATRRSTASREPAPGPGGQQRVGRPAAALGEPLLQDSCGLPGQRGGAVFAAFAMAADVRAGAEVDVADGQAGEFGDAQRGLHGD